MEIVEVEKRPDSLSASIKTFVVLMMIVVIIKMITMFTSLVIVATSDVADSAALEWISIGTAYLFGLISIWMAHRHGIPGAWSPAVSNLQRFAIPAAIALVERLVGYVLYHLLDLHLPYGTIPFPQSLLGQYSVILVQQTLLLIFPLSFLLWLISDVILRRRWPWQTFWVIAAPLAFLLSSGQGAALAALNVPAAPLMLAVAVVYAINLLDVYLYWKFGYVALFTLHLTTYFLILFIKF